MAATVREQRYELAPVEEVRPHPDNAKLGDTDAIGSSIDRSGFYGALVVQRSTGYILVGNHRWKAAQAKGLAELPVIFVDCDADEARRIMVADNRTSDLGTYDSEKLVALLTGFDGDLDGTGYDSDDLARLLNGKAGRPALTDPDAMPEQPAPQTVPGEVWLLGPHRVLCGDATVPSDVDRVMAGGLAECVWTDPPYGVEYVGKTDEALTIENDGAIGLPDLLASAFVAIDACLEPGARIYVAHPAGALQLTFLSAIQDRWRLHETLIWVKNTIVLGHSDYHFRHEPITLAYKAGPGRWGRGGSGWYGDHSAASTLFYDKPPASRDHPTMKPVGLIVECIANSCQPGGVVLDPFGGSGSTLLACEQTGRAARLMELDPRYVDVICRRWQEHTGEKPIAEASGQPHDFTA
jgi:DNA modification methylase